LTTYALSVLVAAGENTLMKHPLAFGAVLYVALMTIAAARAQAPRPLYIDSGTTSPMTVSFTSGSNGYSEIVQAFYATSSNNVLIVSNTGTLLNARDSTYIGYNGSGGNCPASDGMT